MVNAVEWLECEFYFCVVHFECHFVMMLSPLLIEAVWRDSNVCFYFANLIFSVYFVV